MLTSVPLRLLCPEKAVKDPDMHEVTVGLFGYPSQMRSGKLPEDMPLGSKRIGMWVLDKASAISDRVVIIAATEQQADLLGSMASERGLMAKSKVASNANSVTGMIADALEMTGDDLLLAVPSSSPYLSVDLLSLMAELLESRDGVFLREKGDSICEHLFGIRPQPAKISLATCPDESDVADFLSGLVRTMVISWHAVSMLDPMRGSFLVVRNDVDYQTAKRLLSTVIKT